VYIMANVLDVARYLIFLSTPDTEYSMTHLKLQKLVYYSHAWNLALEGVPLVEDDQPEAWIHGPVFPLLYREYRHFGYNEISNDIENLPGNMDALTQAEVDIIDVVWDIYGHYTGKYLENLTHMEEPWLNARAGQAQFDYGANIIEEVDMINYYQARLHGDN
jgi:uncharacterized phage-associated protein